MKSKLYNIKKYKRKLIFLFFYYYSRIIIFEENKLSLKKSYIIIIPSITDYIILSVGKWQVGCEITSKFGESNCQQIAAKSQFRLKATTTSIKQNVKL